ncbi:PCYCGC motif-containing (lipo)protein [Paenibacillus turpanensis]|uniref:PCYCGC motif-containing (lipo)protein n=1 Tax=Paenibacillus turpanensis TaxID=2689078 RepID=UPI00140C47C9|nr:PCYCGC motif-containing (lipo)protein [Paenibacillus turpanensis]
MRKRFTVLSAMVGLTVLVSACGGGGSGGTGKQAAHQHEQTHSHTEHAANGDLRETTASAKTLPAFLDTQRSEIRSVYEVAAMYADVLEYVPCYCGCGESAGHKSNLECFIHERKPDGSIVWDDHGTRCGICLQIAVDAAKMSKQGQSAKQIRDAIDQKYGQNGVKPTPTPMPS